MSDFTADCSSTNGNIAKLTDIDFTRCNDFRTRKFECRRGLIDVKDLANISIDNVIFRYLLILKISTWSKLESVAQHETSWSSKVAEHKDGTNSTTKVARSPGADTASQETNWRPYESVFPKELMGHLAIAKVPIITNSPQNWHQPRRWNQPRCHRIALSLWDSDSDGCIRSKEDYRAW